MLACQQEMPINSRRVSPTWSNRLTILETTFFSPNEFFISSNWNVTTIHACNESCFVVGAKKTLSKRSSPPFQSDDLGDCSRFRAATQTQHLKACVQISQPREG